MHAEYEVSVDPDRNLLRVVLSGFFSREDVSSLHADKRKAMLRLTSAPHQHVTLVDVTACKLQSQEILAEFQSVIDEPRYRSKRIAFVVGSALGRRQVRHILARDQAAWFDTVEEAEAWLFEEPPTDEKP